jgi:hypothetical protein
MNMNETNTSSVCRAFGAVTQAGKPAPRKSIAARGKVIELPKVLFSKTVTPRLKQRLVEEGCSRYLMKKLLYGR